MDLSTKVRYYMTISVSKCYLNIPINLTHFVIEKTINSYAFPGLMESLSLEAIKDHFLISILQKLLNQMPEH